MNLTVFVNQPPHCCRAGTMLSQLPAQLALTESDIALAVNQVIIHRERWSQVPLNEGDRIDAFTLVAGG